MSEFHERHGLIVFALSLPWWLSFLATWIINHETRRAERWLARKNAPASGGPYGGNFVGAAGAMFGAIMEAKAKKAMAAQRAAMEQELAEAGRFMDQRVTSINQSGGITAHTVEIDEPALAQITTGTSNVCIGYNAGYAITTAEAERLRRVRWTARTLEQARRL